VASRSVALAVPPRLRWLQAADRRFGAALVRTARPRATGPAGAIPIGQVRRILVIRPGGLGDAVLLRPMLAALAAYFQAARLDVLAERRNAAALLFGAPRWSVSCYDEAPWQAWRKLRAERYDLVVDTEQYHHLPALLANRLAPRWFCGFATLGRARLQTHPVPYSADRYEAESFLDLARAVSGAQLPFRADRPFLAAPGADSAWAEEALAAAQGRPLAVLLPAAGGSYRLWSAARWIEVCRALQRDGAFVVLLGGADAMPAAAGIVAEVDPTAVADRTGRTTLGQSAALLSRATVAVGTDSGVMHLAYALGTPGVTLFGPGLHTKWGAPSSRQRIVRLGLPCSPCTRDGVVPACPYDVACMRDLDSARVLAAVAAVAPRGGDHGPPAPGETHAS
jgi:ADP-heptose:LPS heptosyltransferase